MGGLTAEAGERVEWSVEQILALAPDPASARAGRDLAGRRRWPSLARAGTLLWGECQGSGKTPYRVGVDLGEPAFHCSCPSRKFPCKHALGLFLLSVLDPAAFVVAEPPEWVAAWQAARARRARSARKRPAAERVKPVEPAAPEATAPEAAAREARRRARVAAGLAELRLWLGDLLREGLAQATAQPPAYWERAVARLVDAQAPALARRLQEAALLPMAGGSGWPAALLERLAQIHLIVEAFERLDTLPEALREDVRAAIGWTIPQEALLAESGLRDRWLVAGRTVAEEGGLRTQRTWLLGERSGRRALVLHFAYGNAPLDVSLVPGATLDAELVFYPSAYPLRAVVKARRVPTERLAALPGAMPVRDALAGYAAALAALPWLDRFPLALGRVVPLYRGGAWLARGLPTGETLPLAPRFEAGWRLLALSGGEPIDLFGEWDGQSLLPLGAVADGTFVHLADDPSFAGLIEEGEA